MIIRLVYQDYSRLLDIGFLQCHHPPRSAPTTTSNAGTIQPGKQTLKTPKAAG
jgi:hypothetical protein